MAVILIFVAVTLTQLMWPGLVYSVLLKADFFRWVYGPEFTEHMAQASGSRERTEEEYRISMWVGVLCLPLNVATILAVCALVSDTQPYQVGLRTHRLGRNVLAGLLGAMVASPLHIANLYIDSWYEYVVHLPPTQHALSVIAQHALPVDRVMIVLSAIVAAPAVEELTFRGLLQPWFSRCRMGGELALLFALALALLTHQKDLRACWNEEDWRGLGIALLPAAFVLLLMPGLLLTRRMSQPDIAGGIYGTAVLFAAAHSSVFPSPIPLFPLGLMLGWLAYRTNSLAGPLVLHALFNLIACVEMFVLYFPAT